MSDYLHKAEKAIEYLSESEEIFAQLKAEHQALKERIRIVEAQGILDSSGSSQAVKQAKSRASMDYQIAVDQWQEALSQFELVNARRKRAELVIEMYRSVNSAMKRGNI